MSSNNTNQLIGVVIEVGRRLHLPTQLYGTCIRNDRKEAVFGAFLHSNCAEETTKGYDDGWRLTEQKGVRYPCENGVGFCKSGSYMKPVFSPVFWV